MAIYSIKELEKLTGIKAHTIRVWEQRYRLISPARSAANVRCYTDGNLRELLNIALLNRKGLKISNIARMCSEEIERAVVEFAQQPAPDGSAQADALALAMLDFDEPAFERIFDAYAQAEGLERAMLHLVYPFLDKLKLMWLAGSVKPAHERFITNLILRKICSATHGICSSLPKNAPTFLLFLPEQDSHELTMAFAHYLMRARGCRVINLGAGLFPVDLCEVRARARPDFVFTILNAPPPKQSAQAFVDGLSRCFPESQLLLTGAQVFSQPLQLPSNARTINSLDSMVRFLDDHQMQRRLKHAPMGAI